MARAKADKALSLLKGVLDYIEFKDVDLVIETVIENITLKQAIFSEIEKVCPSHCILATNTSTFDPQVIGNKTSSQDRIIGPCSAHVMPFLEIVRTEKTSPQVIVDLLSVAKTINKVAVVVRNCPGFAVKRTFFPYTTAQSSHLLVHLGVDLFRIDRVITKLQDLIGYKVSIASGNELAKAYPDRTFVSPLVELLIKSGRNGTYYTCTEVYGRQPKPDLTILPTVEESRRLVNIMPGSKPISVTDQEIVEMLLFPVVNEACRVLDEGIVIQPSDLDVASVLRISFPSHLHIRSVTSRMILNVFCHLLEDMAHSKQEENSTRRNFEQQWIKWIPPLAGSTKIDVDEGCSNKREVSSVAVVARDEQSVCLGAGALILRRPINAIVARLFSIKEGFG
ncbi:peroxisomal fatty acid beta-oxidation multifunctional protein AIM1 [Cannabis sativa]|uniref:peroxisomal fatty acid beta-oxidation multifunctional protein AIM1 n=1 Tax=Cannabis sativa TaxID=3483 RepID=UPI0029CA5CD9|nr:peroxisomal fatty acid beta-oxidation multifunctional protein AIM1 [Cannabis sativa]